MSFSRKGALAVLTALAALSFTATSATAAGTTVRVDSATGSPYSGGVAGSLISDTSHFSSGFVNVDCTRSTLDGSVDSDGSNSAISNASWSSCSNNLGGSTVVTPLNMPWAGAVTYSPQSGGRDGTMTMGGVLTKVDVTDGFGITTTCYYSSGTMSVDVYNPDNSARPESDAVGQAYADGESLSLVDTSTYPSDFLCSGSASFTAVYSLKSSQGATLYLTS